MANISPNQDAKFLKTVRWPVPETHLLGLERYTNINQFLLFYTCEFLARVSSYYPEFSSDCNKHLWILFKPFLFHIYLEKYWGTTLFVCLLFSFLRCHQILSSENAKIPKIIKVFKHRQLISIKETNFEGLIKNIVYF